MSVMKEPLKASNLIYGSTVRDYTYETSNLLLVECKEIYLGCFISSIYMY